MTNVFLTTEKMLRHWGKENWMNVEASMPPTVMATDGTSQNISRLPPSAMAQMMTAHPETMP